jgi:flagellar biosynthesis protein FliQ
VIMLGLVGRWMLHGIAAYTARLWQGIPGFVG